MAIFFWFFTEASTQDILCLHGKGPETSQVGGQFKISKRQFNNCGLYIVFYQKKLLNHILHGSVQKSRKCLIK
jgi:hypothetical protein